MKNDYEKFTQSFYQLSGIDLSQYKEAQMKRRLTSFYERKGFDCFLGLLEAIKKDPEVLEELLDKMTINVSEFYRNGARWDILKQQILPGLLQSNSSLKVWSAACSTGEEPYTLAMILREFLLPLQFRILATDIDEGAMAKAKEGLYHERSIQELPDYYREKWLIQQDQWYAVKDELKKRIEFKKHNLLDDPYPQNLDLIVCRNVLIYFTEEAKHKLYKKFASSLKIGGVLFVGSTEQIFRPDEFNLKVVSPFFYKKI
ncbi:MAG TPA: protein-glutamate O-methyltransferase CheR [Bacillus sp. (in: firmicutes)]|uniref:CheR family methyltransferase n=1 Tax=Bacillus litorisediminis TaxID=2922713 RepID=UPI001FAC4D94|nr:protein-glutamate O-methyltransferase CheR [Bacillus litorisediminis]HWO78793.1 protein-glutamate O-methyltransferase CheR [Bacillus sp. (in: firmicutes)]